MSGPKFPVPVEAGGAVPAVVPAPAAAAQDPLGFVMATDPATGGQKGQKVLRFDLVPPRALMDLARHYGVNAKEHGGKYPARNWEKGYPWSLSFAAMMRHAWELWSGQDRDPETGSYLEIAVAWHAFAIRAFRDIYPEGDDRPTTTRRKP